MGEPRPGPIQGEARARRHVPRAGLLVGLIVVALAIAGALVLVTLPAERGLDPGAARFMRGADRSFDSFTATRDPSYGAFLRRHVKRMIVYSPYFDDKTGWYPSGWVYDDAYAIYRGSTLAGSHSDWILRDASGSPLYIPFGCSGGTCPQYAADISNPTFRRQWIADAETKLSHGYVGLFVDDVNMTLRVSDGLGRAVTPIDPATNRPISYEAWRGYMATFVEEIRAALPHAEIVHNAIWFADSPARLADPYIRREIRAADVINLERGVNDPALTGGTGPGSLRSFVGYVDGVHALGRGVVLGGRAAQRPGWEYALAGYLLISTGRDFLSAAAMTPTNWWPGFDVDLGDARGPWVEWQGVLRREFAHGISLVNEPGGETRHLTLPGPMRNLDGQIVTSLLLSPASGAVLSRP